MTLWQGARRSWERLTVRRVAALVTCAAAIALQVSLANVPLPVDLEATGRFTPAAVALGEQELVVDGPVVGPARVLLSHEGRRSETVDVSFDGARLGEETLEMLRGLGRNPPADTQPIDVITPDVEGGIEGAEPCRSSIRIALPKKAVMSSVIHLFQLGAAGSDRFRALEAKPRGTELAVRVESAAPPGGVLQAQGCQKLLRIGEWEQYVPAPLAIDVVAASDSTFRFLFTSMVEGSSRWGGPEGLLEAFTLGSPKLRPGDPPPFQARAVGVRTLGAEGTAGSTAFGLLARTDGEALLNLKNLRVGSDQFQVTVSGRGKVAVNGKEVTVDLLDRVKRYPLPAGLLTAANAALLAWITRPFFQQRQTPSRRRQAGSGPAAAPARSRGKRRKVKER